MTQNELSEYPDNELLKYENTLNTILSNVCNKNICVSCTHNKMCESWLDIYEILIERGYEPLLKQRYRG